MWAQLICRSYLQRRASWGSYRALDVSDQSMTVKITLNPGHGMNYRSHEGRNEVWTVASDSGRVVIDSVSKEVTAGDVIDLPVGCKHTVSASSTGLQIIEVQMGRRLVSRIRRSFHCEMRFRS